MPEIGFYLHKGFNPKSLTIRGADQSPSYYSGITNENLNAFCKNTLQMFDCLEYLQTEHVFKESAQVIYQQFPALSHEHQQLIHDRLSDIRSGTCPGGLKGRFYEIAQAIKYPANLGSLLLQYRTQLISKLSQYFGNNVHAYNSLLCKANDNGFIVENPPTDAHAMSISHSLFEDLIRGILKEDFTPLALVNDLANRLVDSVLPNLANWHPGTIPIDRQVHSMHTYLTVNLAILPCDHKPHDSFIYNDDYTSASLNKNLIKLGLLDRLVSLNIVNANVRPQDEALVDWLFTGGGNQLIQTAKDAEQAGLIIPPRDVFQFSNAMKFNLGSSFVLSNVIELLKNVVFLNESNYESNDDPLFIKACVYYLMRQVYLQVDNHQTLDLTDTIGTVEVISELLNKRSFSAQQMEGILQPLWITDENMQDSFAVDEVSAGLMPTKTQLQYQLVTQALLRQSRPFTINNLFEDKSSMKALSQFIPDRRQLIYVSYLLNLNNDLTTSAHHLKQLLAHDYIIQNHQNIEYQAQLLVYMLYKIYQKGQNCQLTPEQTLANQAVESLLTEAFCKCNQANKTLFYSWVYTCQHFDKEHQTALSMINLLMESNNHIFDLTSVWLSTSQNSMLHDRNINILGHIMPFKPELLDDELASLLNKESDNTVKQVIATFIDNYKEIHDTIHNRRSRFPQQHEYENKQTYENKVMYYFLDFLAKINSTEAQAYFLRRCNSRWLTIIEDKNHLISPFHTAMESAITQSNDYCFFQCLTNKNQLQTLLDQHDLCEIAEDQAYDLNIEMPFLQAQY